MSTHYLQISHHQQQHETDCLAACAAMVLDYWGYSIRYRRLLKLLKIAHDLGAPSSNLKHLESLRFSVEYGEGSLGDLEACLAQGIPCIAFVDTAFLSYWYETTQHAVVVAGVDDRQVHLYDPFFPHAPQSVSRLEFEISWGEMDNTFACIAPFR